MCSSGKSPNIVKVLTLAKQMGLTTIARVGFTGGPSRELADVVLHVDSDNDGVLEDAHQSLMHGLAQFLRQQDMPDEKLIGTRAF